MSQKVHIIGAGLSGLSAAVQAAAAGFAVVVHEAAPQAGGRCRSYHDATLGMVIDNGNHLLLSANRATLDYLRLVGASDRVCGPERAEFAFVDLASGERWTLALNEGRCPWWIFDPASRVPGTGPADYLPFARLALARSGRVGQVVAGTGPVYERLLRPLLLAALNTEPAEASAALAAAVLRETIVRGGQMCRPLIARDGLTAALVDPALHFLRDRGAAIRFGSRLRALPRDAKHVAGLDFGEGVEPLAATDFVILAVPPVVAAALLPGIAVPDDFRAIVNAHFAISPPPGLPPLTGVLNATSEWIFAFPGRLSVTVSAADRLLDMPREELARVIWRDVSTVAGLAADLPPWQIVRERRATIAATEGENAKRPAANVGLTNLALAGDWTDTGLPATIEGAIRSGHRAAERIIRSRADA